MSHPTFSSSFIAAALAMAAPAFAAGPAILEVQGMFRNLSGQPVVGGEYDLRFSLHTAPTTDGDTEVWGEQALAVPVLDGVVTYAIGATTPLDPALFEAHSALFLEIKIASEPPLPRAPLRSVAWAMHATTAGMARNLECSGCVGVAKVAGAVLDPVNHPYSATISDVTVSNVKGALEALSARTQAIAVQVTELTTTQGGAVTLLAADLDLVSVAVDGLTTGLASLSSELAAHAADPNAHHSSTSDGLAITPSSVGIKGSDVAVSAAGLELAPGAAGVLNADKLAKLVGGPDVLADDLHTHAGAGSSGAGGCYTVFGSSSCGGGFNAMYTGAVVVPAGAIGTGVAVGAAICMAGYNGTETFPTNITIAFTDTRVIPNTPYQYSSRGSRPCAVCCVQPEQKSGATPGCSDSLTVGQSGSTSQFYSYGQTGQVALTVGYVGINYHMTRMTFFAKNEGNWVGNQVPNLRLKFFNDDGTELKTVPLKTVADAIQPNDASFIEMEAIIDLDLAGGNYKARLYRLDGTPWDLWPALAGPYYRLYGCLVN